MATAHDDELFEIERRFLPAGNGWRDEAESFVEIKQGYVVPSALGNMVRVRAKRTSGVTEYKLQGKGDRTDLKVREPRTKLHQDEYRQWAALCGDRWISKGRHLIEKAYQPIEYHIDVFLGRHDPLIVIEAEFKGISPEEARAFSDFPEWVGKEVTDDRNLANSSLATDGLPAWVVDYMAERPDLFPAH